MAGGTPDPVEPFRESTLWPLFVARLTTVDQHPELIGSTTMQLNVERLDGKPVEPGIRWIKTELIARESCGAGLPQAAVEDGGER